MNRKNIMEVTTLSDLKHVMMSYVTIILGLTLPSTEYETKISVRKFLKRKSEKFPLLTFVYMEVKYNDLDKLNILKSSDDAYPLIYHIRGGNQILVSVSGANEETMYGSFDDVEKYYIEEMKNFQKKINNDDASIKSDNTDSHDESKHVAPCEKTDDIHKSNPLPICDPSIEKKKMIEKLILLNKKREEIGLSFIKEVANRKKLENAENVDKHNDRSKSDK